MFKRNLSILILWVMYALLTACGPGQILGPTLTPTNTPTITPTATPLPTETPIPSPTPSITLFEALLTNEQVNELIDLWDSDFVDVDQSKITDPNTGEIITNPLCETECAGRGWRSTVAENSVQLNTLGVNLFRMESQEIAGNSFTNFVLFYDAKDFEIVDNSGIPHELIYPPGLPDLESSYLGLSPGEDELILVVKHNEVIMEIRFMQPEDFSEDSLRTGSDLIYYYGLTQIKNLLDANY